MGHRLARTVHLTKGDDDAMRGLEYLDDIPEEFDDTDPEDDNDDEGLWDDPEEDEEDEGWDEWEDDDE